MQYRGAAMIDNGGGDRIEGGAVLAPPSGLEEADVQSPQWANAEWRGIAEDFLAPYRNIEAAWVGVLVTNDGRLEEGGSVVRDEIAVELLDATPPERLTAKMLNSVELSDGRAVYVFGPGPVDTPAPSTRTPN